MSLIDAFVKKTIEITCEGTLFVDLDELTDLHHYGEISDEQYEHGKASMLRLGYSFPAFVWDEPNGKRWIIDAHTRKQILLKMRDKEGYEIPKLPAVRIFCKDKTEAKEKVLAQESKYKSITEEGFYEFMNEEGAELDEEALKEYVELEEFEKEYGEEEESEAIAPKEKEEITCPACQHTFTK